MNIIQAETKQQVEKTKELFIEYGKSLDFELCFQDFDKELADLPGYYSPPDGRLFLAELGGEIAGCIALRKLEEGICEMKRLYVKPECRGKGVGRALAEAVIAHARDLGYASIKLDTLGSMREANELYASLGFKECSPYRHNPCPCPIFMELALR